jgi:hypothetical protein
VLLIDDDAELASAISQEFEKRDFTSDVAQTNQTRNLESVKDILGKAALQIPSIRRSWGELTRDN